MSQLNTLKEWIDKELKLQGYEHQQILDKIDSLMQEEPPTHSRADGEEETENPVDTFDNNFEHVREVSREGIRKMKGISLHPHTINTVGK